MVFNTTFNNIAVISWQSVLLVEETGGPEKPLTCRKSWGRRGHDHMVVRFTTTYAISAYHH
jgi:hypothetical protein